MTVPIALARCKTYDDGLEEKLFQVLEAAGISIKSGARVLLKPNLLSARPLACASWQVTAAAAKWLLDHGAKVTVADSPAFGSASGVSRAIGLAGPLKKLGLKAKSLSGKKKLSFFIEGEKVSIPVSPLVFDNDLVFSVCRVKAHSQMRLTLCVKNCFGVIPGLHKAFAHARLGRSAEFFAACVAALYSSLPPVIGAADGVTAMSVTGPAKGEPYPLGLLGACADPAALDLALMKILGAPPERVPIAKALGKTLPDTPHSWPLESPDAFNGSGFVLPERLKAASFAPRRLIKSCIKRIWIKIRTRA